MSVSENEWVREREGERWPIIKTSTGLIDWSVHISVWQTSVTGLEQWVDRLTECEK